MRAALRSAHGLANGLLPPRARAAAPRALASPFENPVILWLLAVVALVQFFQLSGLADVVLRLRLPDNDDAMRLVAVRDLISGQGWFDPVQHRHLPPAGVVSHWSRLVDAPIAGLILALVPLLGARLAEGVVAALWPSLLFALFCGLAFAGTKRVFGLRAAILAVFAASQTGAFVGIFALGRIDHHNLQACAILAVGLLLFRADRGWRSRALAGGVCALSLAIGLETLPFVAAAGVIVAADWVISGRGRSLAAFGLAFAAGAFGLFLAQTGPALYAVSYCDALSRPWLWLAGACAVAASALAAAPAATALARAGLAGLAGTVAAASFVALYPGCALSPFGDLPALVRTEWLSQVLEMKPIWLLMRDQTASALGNAMPILVAALAATAMALRSAGAGEGENARARASAVAAAFLWPGVAITLFQVRGIYVGSAFVPVVAGVAFDRALAALRAPGVRPRRRAGLIAGAVLMLGKVWVFALVVPSALAGVLTGGAVGTPLNAPADASAEGWLACTDPARLAALDALAPTTVLAPIDLGPNLLLHTRHAIVAAPYHRAVAGLMADLEGLSGDEATLRRHVAATGAGLLLLCDPWLAGSKESTAKDGLLKDGSAKESGPKAATPFTARLARGEAGAAWLVPVDLPPGPLKAWRVTGP